MPSNVSASDKSLHSTNEERFGIIAVVAFAGRMRAFVHQSAPLDAAALRKLSAHALIAADCIEKSDADESELRAERDAARKKGRR